ncbi:unnamed protein product [Strongylus vulgaris]|uniref:Tartrate-resistant acid phosphatase type 5 n=1 Tax=Strongylus vulgaris TaxID=40348 RepID=A0A3P7IQJ3_STRVU|nr:unnamed protein product [Strongylus vulgaris]
MTRIISGKEPSDSLRLIIVGDTGGIPFYPYYSHTQKNVARIMEILAEQRNLQYVINVGDNIYFTGTSFEDVYNGRGLNVPWFMIAGNHDHFGNVFAQVAYTKYSRKWIFPKLYYKLSFSLNDISVDILMIDTIVLCGNTADIQNGAAFDVLLTRSHVPQGPKEPEKAEMQWRWINENLSASKADYLFVVGHYPIYSTSSHGSTPCLINRLDPMLKAYGVSAYIAGHDHNLQVNQYL